MRNNLSGLVSISFFLFIATSFIWCVYRDIHIEKQYTGDLRNRVVGARLQKDGKSPYFYHWRYEDGIRYYDWFNNSRNLKISNITATPFFHQLLYPLSNLPQRTISRIWLFFEYLAILTMAFVAFKLANKEEQKAVVLLILMFFLYTYGWLTNVEQGQYYIFIPLLMLVFYYFLTRKQAPLNAFGAGISACMLILIRPNALIFLAAFLLAWRQFNLSFKWTLSITVLIFMTCAFATQSSRFYWSQYRMAMNENVKSHQLLDFAQSKNEAVPVVQAYEGWDQSQIQEALRFPFYKRVEEQGNIFILVQLILHRKAPVWLLSVSCILCMLLTCILFWKQYAHTPQLNLYTLALLGFYMYMFTDLFSPIHRANYNASQWIFPLLLTASSYRRSVPGIWVEGTFLGMFLNSLIFISLPMRHTIGEYILFASLLGLLLVPKFKQIT